MANSEANPGRTFTWMELLHRCFYFETSEAKALANILQNIVQSPDTIDTPPREIRGSCVADLLTMTTQLYKDSQGIKKNETTQIPPFIITSMIYWFNRDEVQQVIDGLRKEVGSVLRYVLDIAYYSSGRNIDIRAMCQTVNTAEKNNGNIFSLIGECIEKFEYSRFKIKRQRTVSGHPYTTIDPTNPLPFSKSISLISLNQHTANFRASTSTRQIAMRAHINDDDTNEGRIHVCAEDIKVLNKHDRMLFDQEQSRSICLLKTARMIRVNACYPHSSSREKALIASKEVKKIRKTLSRSRDDTSSISSQLAAEIAGNFLVAYLVNPEKTVKVISNLGIDLPYISIKKGKKNVGKLKRFYKKAIEIFYDENILLTQHELEKTSADNFIHYIANPLRFKEIEDILCVLTSTYPGFTHDASYDSNRSGLTEFIQDINRVKLLLLFSPVRIEQLMKR